MKFAENIFDAENFYTHFRFFHTLVLVRVCVYMFNRSPFARAHVQTLWLIQAICFCYCWCCDGWIDGWSKMKLGARCDACAVNHLGQFWQWRGDFSFLIWIDGVHGVDGRIIYGIGIVCNDTNVMKSGKFRCAVLGEVRLKNELHFCILSDLLPEKILLPQKRTNPIHFLLDMLNNVISIKKCRYEIRVLQIAFLIGNFWCQIFC